MSLAHDIPDATSGTAGGGNAALVELSGRLTPDRLRGLARLLDDAIAGFAEGLQDLVPGVSLRVDATQAPSVGTPAQLGLESQSWATVALDLGALEGPAAILADREAVFLLVELLLGGGAPGRMAVPDRALSAFDLVILRAAVERLVQALATTLSSVLPTPPQIAPPAAGEAVAGLAEDGREAVVCDLKLSGAGEQGRMILLLPTAIGALLRPCRLQAASRRHADPHWQRSLGNRLRETEVRCSAVLDGGEMLLSDVAGLAPGEILWLKTPPDARARFTCDGVTLFSGELGQSEGYFTLRIEEEAAGTRAFLEAMAGSRGDAVRNDGEKGDPR